MADRSVNINIKYNVNTAEVLKAQRASEAAQKATDDLRKASDAYAKAATAAHKEAAQSAKQTAQATQAVEKQFSDLYSTVRLVLAGGIAKELVGITLQMATLSGKIEGVEKAFGRLPNSVLLLRSMREATHGTVTDLELMQKSLQASNFRIPLEKLGKLFEFATVKAQQTGQEVNHLVDYIVSGIGYRSIKRLDDLGFTANRVKEALGGVSLQAATMAQVMEAVTKLMDEDLQKTGGYAETTATQVEAIKVALFDLEAVASKKATSSGLLSYYKNIIETATTLLKIQYDYTDLIKLGLSPAQFAADIKQRYEKVKVEEMLTEAAEKQAQSIQNRNQKLKEGERLEGSEKELFNLAISLKGYKEQEAFDNKRLATLKEEIAELEKQNKSSLTLHGLRVGLQKLGTDEAKLIDKKKDEVKDIEATNLSRQDTQKILEQTIGILFDYRDSIKITNEAEQENIGIVANKRKEIEALEEQLEATTKMGDLGLGGKLTSALKKAQEELKVLLKSDTEAVANYLSYLSDLEMFNDKALLKERKEGRDKLEKIDEENAKRSLKLAEYFAKLRIQKEKEVSDESIAIAEDEAKKKAQLQQLRIKVSGLAKDILVDQVNSLLQAEISADTDRINQLKDFYDNQIELAGDNENAKQQIKKRSEREITKLEHERADKEKRAAEAGILVNTALGIVKAFATSVTIYDGIVAAALVAAEGASQYAIASRARYYAKGEIDIKGGTPGKDSIPAYLMPGESIMTTKQTREAFGILTDVRAGKLNDKILKQLVVSGGVSQAFDDSRMVDAISKNRAPDVVRIASDVYEVKKDRDGNRRFIRSKSI